MFCDVFMKLILLSPYQEHRDLEARIAQIIKSAESTTSEAPPAAPARPQAKRDRHNFQTRPYNDDEEEEVVMDDEELHSLLGV